MNSSYTLSLKEGSHGSNKTHIDAIEMNEAATKIQAGFRGMQARKQVAVMVKSLPVLILNLIYVARK